MTYFVDHGVGIVLRVLSSRCFFSFCGYLIMGLERRNINEGVLWFFKLSCWYLRERDCLWFLFIGNSILKKFCYQNWRKIPSFVLFWEWTLGNIFFYCETTCWLGDLGEYFLSWCFTLSCQKDHHTLIFFKCFFIHFPCFILLLRKCLVLPFVLIDMSRSFFLKSWFFFFSFWCLSCKHLQVIMVLFFSSHHFALYENKNHFHHFRA